MGITQVFLLFTSLSLLAAQNDIGSLKSKVSKFMNVNLNDKMSSKDQYLFLQDLDDLKSLDIDASEMKFFQKVFGGTKIDSVIKFIDPRINYVFPWNIQIATKIFGNEPNTGARIMATNSSLEKWLESLNVQNGVSVFTFNDRPIEIKDIRIGIFNLGEGYNDQTHQIVRFGTLIHEARHSDCTGGLTEADYATIRTDFRTAVNIIPKCGHQHVVCPPGHPLENLPACDGHAFGAYAVAGVLMMGIANHCKNCSEKEKYVAQLTAIDNFYRIPYFEEMLLQEQPDMSSTGIRQ